MESKEKELSFNFDAYLLVAKLGINESIKTLANAIRLECKSIAYAGNKYCTTQELENLLDQYEIAYAWINCGNITDDEYNHAISEIRRIRIAKENLNSNRA